MKQIFTKERFKKNMKHLKITPKFLLNLDGKEVVDNCIKDELLKWDGTSHDVVIMPAWCEFITDKGFKLTTDDKCSTCILRIRDSEIYKIKRLEDFLKDNGYEYSFEYEEYCKKKLKIKLD